MGILLEVAVISLFMSLLLVVLSKFLTNQKELKRIKQEVQDYESKIKEAKKAGDQKAAADYSSKKLKVAMGQFNESRKSMMVSMVVGLIAIYVLQAGYTGFSFNVEQSTLDNSPVLKGSLADGKQVVFYDSSNLALDMNKNSVFEQEEKFKIEDVTPYNDGFLKFKEPKNGKASAEIIVAKSPFRMPFVGYEMSWFVLYLFITLATTLIFRKLLDVQ